MRGDKTAPTWLRYVLATEHYMTTSISWIVTFMFIVMMAVIFIQVVCRFVLFISIPWSEEIVRYIWISIAFIGAGAAVSLNAHIEIDILGSIIKNMKNNNRKRLAAKLSDILRYLILLALSLYMTNMELGYTLKIHKTNQLSAAMHMPMWILDALITFGFFSVAVHCIIRLIISFKNHSLIINSRYIQGGEA